MPGLFDSHFYQFSQAPPFRTMPSARNTINLAAGDAAAIQKLPGEDNFINDADAQLTQLLRTCTTLQDSSLPSEHNEHGQIEQQQGDHEVEYEFADIEDLPGRHRRLSLSGGWAAPQTVGAHLESLADPGGEYDEPGSFDDDDDENPPFDLPELDDDQEGPSCPGTPLPERAASPTLQAIGRQDHEGPASGAVTPRTGVVSPSFAGLALEDLPPFRLAASSTSAGSDNWGDADPSANVASAEAGGISAAAAAFFGWGDSGSSSMPTAMDMDLETYQDKAKAEFPSAFGLNLEQASLEAAFNGPSPYGNCTRGLPASGSNEPSSLGATGVNGRFDSPVFGPLVAMGADTGGASMRHSIDGHVEPREESSGVAIYSDDDWAVWWLTQSQPLSSSTCTASALTAGPSNSNAATQFNPPGMSNPLDFPIHPNQPDSNEPRFPSGSMFDCSSPTSTGARPMASGAGAGCRLGSVLVNSPSIASSVEEDSISENILNEGPASQAILTPVTSAVWRPVPGDAALALLWGSQSVPSVLSTTSSFDLMQPLTGASPSSLSFSPGIQLPSTQPSSSTPNTAAITAEKKKKKSSHHGRSVTTQPPRRKSSASASVKKRVREPVKAKNLKCSQCPRTFSRPYNLRTHEQTHSGIKKYVCPVCAFLAGADGAASGSGAGPVGKGGEVTRKDRDVKSYARKHDLARHLDAAHEDVLNWLNVSLVEATAEGWKIQEGIVVPAHLLA